MIGQGKTCLAFWNALGFVLACALELIGLALTFTSVILMMTNYRSVSWPALAIGLVLTGLFHHVWFEPATSV